MILTTMLYVWAANAAMIFCFRFRYPISLLVNIFSTNYSVCSIKKDCEVYMYLWFSSVAQSRPTLCHPMNHSTPGLPVHHQLPEMVKLMTIESMMPSSHLILCRPLLLLPPIPPSIRVFSNESALCIRWPKYWGFSFSISPSNEHPPMHLW